MRDLKYLGHDLEGKSKKLVQAIQTRIPPLIGEHFVDGFRRSFQDQRFNEDGSQKWKQVKRRTPGDPWYGFNYKSNGKVGAGARGNYPSGNPRRYGTRGGITNYTSTATTRAILHGWGSVGLKMSIFLAHASRGLVVVASNKPYASVHNEGGTAKIFGGKTFKMPKRKFMGNSKKLDRGAKVIIDKVITKIIENNG